MDVVELWKFVAKNQRIQFYQLIFLYHETMEFFVLCHILWLFFEIHETQQFFIKDGPKKFTFFWPSFLANFQRQYL